MCDQPKDKTKPNNLNYNLLYFDIYIYVWLLNASAHAHSDQKSANIFGIPIEIFKKRERVRVKEKVVTKCEESSKILEIYLNEIKQK